MLGDSSPLPKCGSASLTFRWLLLFVEIGLKTAARFSFFFFARSTLPPTWIIPIHSHLWALYYRTNLLLHMGIYIQQRENWWMNFRCVSQEFERMFPFLDWGKTLRAAPGNLVSEVPVLQFPFDYLTSNWSRYSNSLLLAFCMKQSKCMNIIHNTYTRSHD